MSPPSRGFSIVECLVALTLLNLGLLAALSTVAASLRLAHRGDQAAAAGRLMLETVDRIRATVRAGGGRCSAVTAGEERAPTGEAVAWAAGTVPHGRSIRLRVTYPTARGEFADTVPGFVSCSE